MKKTAEEPITIPVEIADKILCLRPYQNDVIPEELVMVATHSIEMAREQAYSIIRIQKDVVRVVLCGMGYNDDTLDVEVIESGVVWTVPQAKPWYVSIKKTYQQKEPEMEHYVLKEEAYKRYRDLKENGRDGEEVIVDTNARAGKKDE